MRFKCKEYKYNPHTGNHYEECSEMMFADDVQTLRKRLESEDYRLISEEVNELVMVKPYEEMDAMFLICNPCIK